MVVNKKASFSEKYSLNDAFLLPGYYNRVKEMISKRLNQHKNWERKL